VGGWVLQQQLGLSLALLHSRGHGIITRAGQRAAAAAR
jgi:hypothetical protein